MGDSPTSPPSSFSSRWISIARSCSSRGTRTDHPQSRKWRLIAPAMRRHGVGGERRAAVGVVAVDGLHQREGGDLLEVLERLAAAGEAAGQAAREREVARARSPRGHAGRPSPGTPASSSLDRCAAWRRISLSERRTVTIRRPRASAATSRASVRTARPVQRQPGVKRRVPLNRAFSAFGQRRYCGRSRGPGRWRCGWRARAPGRPACAGLKTRLRWSGILTLVTPRGTDWSLALLVAAGVASGLATWFAGSPGAAWVYGAHAVAGLSLAVCSWSSCGGCCRALAPASVAALSLVVLVLGTGFVWAERGRHVPGGLQRAGVARRARRRARRRRARPRGRARQAPAPARPREPPPAADRRRGRRRHARGLAGPAAAAARARAAGRRAALHRLLRRRLVQRQRLPGHVMGRRRPAARGRAGGRRGARAARARRWRRHSSTAATS